MHIPILLLHECEITKAETSLSEGYLNKIKEQHIERANAFVKKKLESDIIKVNLYDEITFHLIIFPIPNKEVIVKSFIEKCNAFVG